MNPIIHMFFAIGEECCHISNITKRTGSGIHQYLSGMQSVPSFKCRDCDKCMYWGEPKPKDIICKFWEIKP